MPAAIVCVIVPQVDPDATDRVLGAPQLGAAEPWVHELRERFVDAGFDHSRVNELLGESLARYQSGRWRQFVPLLVERSVNQALRDD